MPIVAGMGTVVEYGHLSLKAPDCTIDVGFGLHSTCIGQQIAGLEIVTAIHHHIIVCNKFFDIAFSQPIGVHLYRYAAVQFAEAPGSEKNLRLIQVS